MLCKVRHVFASSLINEVSLGQGNKKQPSLQIPLIKNESHCAHESGWSHIVNLCLQPQYELN